MIEFERLSKVTQYREDFIELFRQLENYLDQFIIFKSEDQRTVLVNWIVHTHLIHLFSATPYLHIYSAELRCGKTLLMNLLHQLSRKSISTINITEAIFRYINKVEPTLIIDEVDRFFGEEKFAIEGILNAGFIRYGGGVLRTVGNAHDPEEFEVFCPKVFSGIGKSAIANTLRDRSIPIQLERKLPDEEVKRYRHRRELQVMEEIKLMLEPLQELSELWDDSQEDYIYELVKDEIEDDRALDIIEPLLLVASMGTPEWLFKTINACTNLMNSREEIEDKSFHKEVLRVCNQIRMLNVGQKYISTEDLLKEINNTKDSYLAHYNNWGIDASQLAKALGEYNIKASTRRFDSTTRKGYRWSDFAEPCRRYLGEVEEEEVEQVNEEPTVEEQVELF